ncbi:MAG TPA: hypothetical protein VK698_32025 [Kofleriaceae bacterium]|nr:hypothetical protein [Kofleriaceae bacterium]
MEWQSRLLEELIYERVRLHVDLLDLIDFEKDLSQSINRALQASGADPNDEDATARRYIERAWQRLEREWTRERASDWADCPLCEAPLQCPEDHAVTGRAAASRGGASAARPG